MNIFQLFEPIYKLLPEVVSPKVKQPLKRRLIWTGVVLVLFFIMGKITLIGLDATTQAAQQLATIQMILASPMGSLISAGIGPIVLASIILQLLMGAGILKINIADTEDKVRFMSMQKLFAIVLSFFEAGAYSGFGIFPSLISPLPGMGPFIILQIALGSIILLYLDEIVSKWGFGSGISLFIAAGISGEILWRVFAPPLQEGAAKGLLLLIADAIASGAMVEALLLFTPIIATLAVFFIVVFVEGIHVNIPIAMGAKGLGGSFPVKFLYVSNMPVILAASLFANFQLWAIFTKNVPILGQIMDAVAYLTNSPYTLVNDVVLQGVMAATPQILQAAGYTIIMIVFCIVFGKFWVEMGGQGAENIAKQLSTSGMYIPGFRRDERIILGVLNKYIPPITILGSAFVGLLAAFADFSGAIGTGTGILLTVGIVYRLYEDLAKQQVMESQTLLKRLLGG